MKPIIRRTGVFCSAISLCAAVAVTGFAGAASAKSSKRPIWIGTEVPVTAQLNLGASIAGDKAAVYAINRAGGINGHKIEVFTCDTQASPNQELACAQQAVSKGVVAMVGTGIAFNPEVFAYLAAHHVADIEDEGPLPQNDQGNNTFAVTWESGTYAPCVSKLMAKISGGRKFANVEVNDAGGMVTNGLMVRAAANQHLSYTPIFTPETVSDYSPYTATAEKDRVNSLTMSAFGAGPQAIVQASASSGAKYTLCTTLDLLEGGWAKLGNAARRVYVGATFKPLSDSASLPAMKQLIANFHAVAARGVADAGTSPGVFNSYGMQGYLGTEAFGQAARKIKGAITPSSFLAAIRKATVSFGGIIPSVNFRHYVSGGPYHHVYNAVAYLWKWNPKTDNYTDAGEVKNTFGLMVK